MIVVKHRFLEHQINPLTETLIIGTFNPDSDNNTADFFYGRGRNFLWRLLPTVFGDQDLKGKSLKDKLEFIDRKKIDFIDLISEVKVDEPDNYYDAYIDNKVSIWRNVIEEIKKLHSLKRVCFTRRSFSGIPQMRKHIEEIQRHCAANKINFLNLITPARFYRLDKQQEWNNFFHH